MSTSRAVKFIGGASEIAHYYGFRPLWDFAPQAAKSRSLTPVDAALACADKYTPGDEPLLAFYATPGSSNNPAPARESGTFSLQIIGCQTSIGEIHILKTLQAIVAEMGDTVGAVRINSLGDKDSRARFARELGSFLRRHAPEYDQELTAQERTHLSDNPVSAYRSRSQKLQEVLLEAPRPVHYLSEKSRTHFRQVLDHLERVDFPYMIDNTLIGDEREPRVTFALELTGESVLTASIGGRYDDLVIRPGGRSTVPAVHASLEFRNKTPLSKSSMRLSPLQPKVYFIQFGDSAKLCGFSVIDTLRRARVPVGQSFDARHLAPQLIAAQGLGVPYVLIMGAREALDQTIIIRTLATSAQTTVPICDLPKHLRALKLV